MSKAQLTLITYHLKWLVAAEWIFQFFEINWCNKNILLIVKEEKISGGCSKLWVKRSSDIQLKRGQKNIGFSASLI